MYSSTTPGRSGDSNGPAGFKRTVNLARERYDRRVSITVLAVLALAVIASAAALPIEDGVSRGGQSAAWNLSHGQVTSRSAGG